MTRSMHKQIREQPWDQANRLVCWPLFHWRVEWQVRDQVERQIDQQLYWQIWQQLRRQLTRTS